MSSISNDRRQAARGSAFCRFSRTFLDCGLSSPSPRGTSSGLTECVTHREDTPSHLKYVICSLTQLIKRTSFRCNTPFCKD